MLQDPHLLALLASMEGKDNISSVSSYCIGFWLICLTLFDLVLIGLVTYNTTKARKVRHQRLKERESQRIEKLRALYHKRQGESNNGAELLELLLDDDLFQAVTKQ